MECPPPFTDLSIYQREKEFFGLTKSRDIAVEIDDTLPTTPPVKNVLCCDKQIKLKIHQFLLNSPTSTLATVYFIVDIVMIALSTVLFLLESEPSLNAKFDERSEAKDKNFAYWMFGLNGVAIVWFTVDIIVRMVTWPVFINYWKNFMNVLDVITVTPFYIGIIEWMAEANTDSNYQLLQALRLVRVMRVYKFVRHSKSVILIVKAMIKASNELLVLFLSLFIFVVTCGAVMFFVEGGVEVEPGIGPNTNFSSILMSCWWVLVSVTTVGFGDMYPVTVLGKLLGSVILFFGIICIALPMTIIITKFSIEYDKDSKNNPAKILNNHRAETVN